MNLYTPQVPTPQSRSPFTSRGKCRVCRPPWYAHEVLQCVPSCQAPLRSARLGASIFGPVLFDSLGAQHFVHVLWIHCEVATQGQSLRGPPTTAPARPPAALYAHASVKRSRVPPACPPIQDLLGAIGLHAHRHAWPILTQDLDRYDLRGIPPRSCASPSISSTLCTP
ncbi:hypothetical protein BKA93DRAFT_359453 [Sparassis latifolia]